MTSKYGICTHHAHTVQCLKAKGHLQLQNLQKQISKNNPVTLEFLDQIKDVKGVRVWERGSVKNVPWAGAMQILSVPQEGGLFFLLHPKPSATIATVNFVTFA